jgi:peptidoglycan/LPS O-acetylase OafA/YrhL
MTTSATPAPDLAHPAPAKRIAYVPALDGMRGVSLPGTIYTHFQICLGFLPTAPGWIQHSAPFELNIEMFFVLSGALITSLLVGEHQRSGTIAMDRFYLRRSRRLAPALICAVPLLLIAQYLIPSHKDAFFGAGNPLGPHPWIAGLFILLFIGNWRMATGGTLGWMNPAWTLGIEEQFYLTWPALLRIALRRGWGRRQILSAIWGAIAACVLAAIVVIYPHFGASHSWWVTFVQVPPILLGCALGYALQTHAEGWFVRALAQRRCSGWPEWS